MCCGFVKSYVSQLGSLQDIKWSIDDPSVFKDDAGNDYEDDLHVPEHLNDNVGKGVLVALHPVCLLARLHLLVTEKREKNAHTK